MTTNQPTDATRFKAALYAQCPEPVADDIWQRFESLTAQLAAVQAEAKAWEAWGNEVDRLASAIRRQHSGPCGQDSLSMERNQAAYKTATQFKKLCLSRPQPVDASSLARIAKSFLAVWACHKNYPLTENARQALLKPHTDSLSAIQPIDIALAQALVGGAL